MSKEGKFSESDIKAKVMEFIKENFLIDTKFKNLDNNDSFFEEQLNNW